ncbi:MAG: PQQ-dependent sugar dehydrogenase [Chloroflexota bacterium]
MHPAFRNPLVPLQHLRKQAARLVFAMFALLISGCGGQPGGADERGPSRQPREVEPTVEPQSSVKPTSEIYLNGLQIPSALTFAPDGRLFFVEVNAGRIRVAIGTELQAESVHTIPVAQNAESGLLGMTLDPDFLINHYVYAYYTVPDPTDVTLGLMNRVIRFTEQSGRSSDVVTILDNLPVNVIGPPDFHQGGSLAFGPDRKLYVSIGDVGKPESSQDPGTAAGKILRVNADGSIPADNPFPGSAVFALGFRNVWGMTFHPTTGVLYASENGSKSHDEVNVIYAGKNYGWPVAEGTSKNSRYADPLWDSGSSGLSARNGMVGLTFYHGSVFPELQGDLLFCAFKTGRIRRATLTGPSFERIQSISRLEGECRLDITVGPDGAIYTSNITQILRLAR